MLGQRLCTYQVAPSSRVRPPGNSVIRKWREGFWITENSSSRGSSQTVIGSMNGSVEKMQ